MEKYKSIRVQYAIVLFFYLTVIIDHCRADLGQRASVFTLP